MRPHVLDALPAAFGLLALGAGRSVADARTAAAVTGQELEAMGIITDADAHHRPRHSDQER